jgi:hypothetical protein
MYREEFRAKALEPSVVMRGAPRATKCTESLFSQRSIKRTTDSKSEATISRPRCAVFWSQNPVCEQDSCALGSANALCLATLATEEFCRSGLGDYPLAAGQNTVIGRTAP